NPPSVPTPAWSCLHPPSPPQSGGGLTLRTEGSTPTAEPAAPPAERRPRSPPNLAARSLTPPRCWPSSGTTRTWRCRPALISLGRVKPSPTERSRRERGFPVPEREERAVSEERDRRERDARSSSPSRRSEVPPMPDGTHCPTCQSQALRDREFG